MYTIQWLQKGFLMKYPPKSIWNIVVKKKQFK